MEAPRWTLARLPRCERPGPLWRARLGWSGGWSASSPTTRPAGPLAVYFYTNLVGTLGRAPSAVRPPAGEQPSCRPWCARLTRAGPVSAFGAAARQKLASIAVAGEPERPTASTPSSSSRSSSVTSQNWQVLYRS